MLGATVTRAPRASRCCFAISILSASLGDEIANTAMWGFEGSARGATKCPVPRAPCPVTPAPDDWARGTGHWALSKSVERICKPNSVFLADEDHSSVTRVAAVIEQPTRKLDDGNGRFHRFPIWSCSAGGLPCRRRSRGTRCALTAPFHPCLPLTRDRRFVFCCTFRRVAAPGRYPACCPLEFGLSSVPLRGTAILRSAPHKNSNS